MCAVRRIISSRRRRSVVSCPRRAQAKLIHARSSSGACARQRYRLTCLAPSCSTFAAMSSGSGARGIAGTVSYLPAKAMRYAWKPASSPRGRARPAEDRPRAGVARPARLPQPRPRRRPGGGPLGRGAAGAQLRGAGRGLRRAGCATSTPRAPTAAAEEFLGAWLRRPPARRRRRRLEVGLRLHRRLGGRRRPAGGQAPRRRHAAPPARTRPANGSATTSTSTRSTPPRRTAACSRTRRCWARCATCARAGWHRRLGQRDRAGRHDRPRRRARMLRRGPGDLEPARARGRAGAAARPRRGPGRDRQGGARQRPARPARAPPRARRAAARLGATPDAVALAAVLAQPFADVVLSGVATRETLASNLAAATLALPARRSPRWRRSRRTARRTGARARRCPGTDCGIARRTRVDFARERANP